MESIVFAFVYPGKALDAHARLRIQVPDLIRFLFSRAERGLIPIPTL